jgi:hypothetical protein
VNISRPFFIGVILVGPMLARAPTLVRASGNAAKTKDNSENTEHERGARAYIEFFGRTKRARATPRSYVLVRPFLFAIAGLTSRHTPSRVPFIPL